jgi:hypothetical protein
MHFQHYILGMALKALAQRQFLLPLTSMLVATRRSLAAAP